MTLADYEPIIRQVIASAVHDGTVSSNDTRPLFAAKHPEIPGHHIGQVYRKLQREGVLVRDEYVVSTDVDGGNNGKLIPTYRVQIPHALTSTHMQDAQPVRDRLHVQRFPTEGPCASCGVTHERYGPGGRPLCEWCAA